MKQERTENHQLGTLAVLTVFCVFAVCILTVILFGAKAYQSLNEQSEENYQSRTLSLFLSGKLRQAQLQSEVTVTAFGDGDCIGIPEELDGEWYCTWLYCKDGWLMELFGEADFEYEPEEGEKILRADDLEAEVTDGILSVRARTENGAPVSLTFALRGGEA